MQKIPTLFKRDRAGNLTLEPNLDEAGWFFEGDPLACIATRKLDGSAVIINGEGVCLKRLTVPAGAPPPPVFVAAQDPEPGRDLPGWVPINTRDKWHQEALERLMKEPGHEPGTYELCGPKVNRNPERLEDHRFIKHGAYQLIDAPIRPGWQRFATPADIDRVHAGELSPPSTVQQAAIDWFFCRLHDYLRTHDIEGIVWYEIADKREFRSYTGRMAKIKGKDFGLRRPKPEDG